MLHVHVCGMSTYHVVSTLTAGLGTVHKYMCMHTEAMPVATVFKGDHSKYTAAHTVCCTAMHTYVRTQWVVWAMLCT